MYCIGMARHLVLIAPYCRKDSFVKGNLARLIYEFILTSYLWLVADKLVLLRKSIRHSEHFFVESHHREAVAFVQNVEMLRGNL